MSYSDSSDDENDKCVKCEEGDSTCFHCKKSGCDKCIPTVCCDCCVSMCSKCEGRPNILCGCYGRCTSCGVRVNRGEHGWPCNRCDEWLCDDCGSCSCNCAECETGDSTCFHCKKTGCDKCIRNVCCECCVSMCSKCEGPPDILCGCYGRCTKCGVDVNRGEHGAPCNQCDDWLCGDCGSCSCYEDPSDAEDNDDDDK